MSTMSESSLTTSTAGSLSSSSSKELCAVCQKKPYDLICACGDKFDFTCIHRHVEQIDLEFQYVRTEVGQRLLQVEQIVEDNNCVNAKTIVENWKRKRIQDINDIADRELNEIQERENAYADVASFRINYNSVSQEPDHITHEPLNSMVALQRHILEKSDQLEALPGLLYDDISLNSKLRSKLYPDTFQQTSTTHETESIISSSSSTGNILMSTEPITNTPITTTNTNLLLITEPSSSAPITTSNTGIQMNTEPTITIPETTLNRNSTINIEPTIELINDINLNHSTTDSVKNDEFEAGETAIVQRRNPIIISTNNDKFAGTICCHENQLLFNNCHQHARNVCLTLIPDIAQPTIRHNIDWPQPDTIISGGDDNWIQDIAYSTKLQGYLLLNRARLRLLRDDRHELEEFYQFPDRSMKRVTCNDTYIYLISAAGSTGQNGDEIIMLNYDKEEKICKTFRDIVFTRNHRMYGPLVGEISDLAVSTNGQIIISYRLARRQEVGVFIYNVSNDGDNWSPVKQLLLNNCWHDDLSYTPRITWLEKLNVFMLVEYITGHLIILDQTGQVKGESRFSYGKDLRESPLNLSVSNNNWLCIRYESSINIHRLEDSRL